MLRIYADFNCIDVNDRVLLHTVGSLEDLRNIQDRGEEILEGMRVILYMTAEFEVQATLVFEKIWMGIPDWSTIHYLTPDDTPTRDI